MSQPSDKSRTRKMKQEYYKRTGKIVSVDFNRSPVDAKALEYMHLHKPYQMGGCKDE